MATSGSQLEQRTTSEIVAEALILAALPEVEPDKDAADPYWNCIGELHRRGGQSEFDAAIALLMGATAVERSLGASILGQLGYGKTFVDESVTWLIQALSDPDETVVIAAAHSLGHRHCIRAIEPLLTFVNHGSKNVRFAVAHGLGCLNDRRATDGLIVLARDIDHDVRDYASFYLGEMCAVDYPELRAALHDLLADPAAVVRGQALIGLARRGDRTCSPSLHDELQGEYAGVWAVKAAGYLADPSLTGELDALFEREQARMPSWHLGDFKEAIEACRSGTPIPPDR
jgi:HEAT repeat protein